MSKLTNGEGLSLKQEEARANYTNMCQSIAAQSFDINSIEEKIKKFKFAGKTETNDTSKDVNWFQKLQSQQ